jgi:hypothetical protein
VTYLSTVQADNPTHYWRLADPVGSGVFFDLVAAARSGLFNDVLFSGAGYTGPAGDGGSAWFISGASHPRTHLNVLPNLPFTLECWVWSLGDPTAAMSLLSTSQGFQFYLDAAMKPNVKGTNNNFVAGAALVAEAWHHFLATFTAAASQLWVDGVNVAGGADVNVNGASKLAVGCNLAGATPFGGYIAEVAVYGAALAAGRIAAHLAAATSVASTPVIGTFSGNPFTSPTAGTTSDTTTLASILASVRKTY